jgi:CheY-specific phosphatase CheX
MGDSDDWMEALSESAIELAQTTLGCEVTMDSPPESVAGLDLTNCLVALVGEGASVQIGLAADPRGCQGLAQLLLAAEEELPESDVSDAMGEIANIVGGGVKKRMANQFGGMRLGLPVVLQGHLELTRKQRVAQRSVLFGETAARLIVIRMTSG